MKIKVFLTVLTGLLFASALTLRAEENALVTEFRTFVGKAETDGKNYTEAQWNEANKTFDILVGKFKKQKDSLTDKERGTIHDLIGRYKAAVTNSGFDSAIKGVTDTYNTVAGATTDAWHETKSFFKGIFKKKSK